MKKKTKRYIFYIVVCGVWPVCILFFEGLYINQSIILTIGLFAFVVYDRVKFWWANVKIKNPKAIHDRGQVNISGTDAYVDIPAEFDKDGKMIYPRWFGISNDSIHMPSKYFSWPGGAEDGWTFVPYANVIVVGKCLNLNTADVTRFQTLEKKEELPPNIIPNLIEVLNGLGLYYNDEYPIDFGWVCSDDVRKGELDVYQVQKNALGYLHKELLKKDIAIDQWRKRAISRKVFDQEMQSNQPQPSNQDYPPNR